MNTTDSIIRSEAKLRNPAVASEVDSMVFGCVAEDAFEATIAADVQSLRAEKVLEGVVVRGMALDTFTGEVREIVV